MLPERGSNLGQGISLQLNPIPSELYSYMSWQHLYLTAGGEGNIDHKDKVLVNHHTI